MCPTLAEVAFGALDIGGTKIAVGIVEAGRCLWSAEIPTHALQGPEAATDRVASLLSAACQDFGFTLEAIGVGCTGPVFPLTGQVGDVALLPGWEGFTLVQALEERLQVPACLENDCDAAAIGEERYGAGRGVARFLYITISTGIGAGFIVDGHVDRGPNGTHPELGHHSIEASGRSCYCGATGCWELLASGTAIAARYAEVCGTPCDSAKTVFEKAALGDRAAIDTVERFTFYLGVGLGNVMTTLAPDIIALGGGVMASHEAFLPRAAEIAQSRAKLIPNGTTSIRTAFLGREAGLIGAAYAAAGLISKP
jgi:glucokinase